MRVSELVSSCNLVESLMLPFKMNGIAIEPNDLLFRSPWEPRAAAA